MPTRGIAGTEVVLDRIDDFGGGHWGTIGPAKAQGNQWGGYNVALTRRGGIAPVSASRRITTDAVTGEIFGMRWAWGLDGLLYFVQDVGGTAYVKRFDPDPTASVSLTTVDSIADPTVTPDWFIAGGYLYLTIYGQSTYQITPSGPSLTALTGSSGNAPAGRAIAVYGERMLIGGISDARFGTYPSRVVYSEAADFTDWPSLNFFDVGGDGRQVRAIVPVRDQCLIVLEDGQVWQLTGVPGVDSGLRRVHGFDRSAGALSGFRAQHIVIDPTQAKAWLYDHSSRNIARYVGNSVTRLPGFGSPASNRTMADQNQGEIVSIGGPDEVYAVKVAIPAAGAANLPQWTGLLRHAGAWAAIAHTLMTQEG